MSIRSRIFLSFTLLITISFYYLSHWIIGDLKPRYREAIEESEIDVAVALAGVISEQVTDGRIDTALFRKAYDRAMSERFSARIYDLLKDRIDLRVYIANEQGIVVYDSDNGHAEGKDYSQWRDVLLTLKGEYGARTTRDERKDPTSTVLYVAAPIRDASGRIIGTLTVCKPTHNSNIFIETESRKIMWGAFAVCVSVLLLAILTAGMISRPIRSLTAYARAVRDGRRAALPQLDKSEIGELGLAFEEMREALEGKKYVEHYVQTLTHEIKSPLSAIQGAAELLGEEMPLEARAKFLGNIRSEVQRARALIDKLLQLSALESRRQLQDVEEVDVNRLIADDVLPALEGAYRARGLTIDFRPAGAAHVRGERFLLRQAVSNLLQNAIEFSPPGAPIAISCSATGDGVTVTIDDRGPGVPDYALERVFERFYSLQRPDTRQKSSGLGLSLVKEVAELHGGSCTLRNRPEGGARVQLTVAREVRERR